MVSKLKGKSIASGIRWMVLLCIISAGFLFYNDFSALKVLQPPADIRNVSTAELSQYVGKMVSMDVMQVFDSYAYTEDEDGKLISQEYVISTPDQNNAMGIVLVAADVDTMEDSLIRLARHTGAQANAPIIPITGTLQEMDSESVAYFNETLADLGADTSLAAHYYLQVNQAGTLPTRVAWAMLALSVGLAFIGVLLFILAIAGVGQRSIKAYLRTNDGGETDYANQKLEQEWEQGEDFKSVRMTPNFIIYQKGIFSKLIETKNIAWAYQKTTRRNGVPISFELMLGVTAPKKKMLNVGFTAKTIEKSMDYVMNHYTWVALGYNPNLKSLYAAQPEALRPIAQQQRQPAPPPMPMPNPGTPQYPTTPGAYSQPGAPM